MPNEIHIKVVHVSTLLEGLWNGVHVWPKTSKMMTKLRGCPLLIQVLKKQTLRDDKLLEQKEWRWGNLLTLDSNSLMLKDLRPSYARKEQTCSLTVSGIYTRGPELFAANSLAEKSWRNPRQTQIHTTADPSTSSLSTACYTVSVAKIWWDALITVWPLSSNRMFRIKGECFIHPPTVIET